MDSKDKDGMIGVFIVANIILIVWFSTTFYLGYQNYIQFPNTQQPTQCGVQETNTMKWSNKKFQAIWSVNFTDINGLEKLSKIFIRDYNTLTDAIEATMNNYKIDEVYKCYFNIEKPYDLLWTVDENINRGKRNLIIAFVLGIILVFSFTIPIVYLCRQWYKKMNISRKI